jgi:hypothetical protein
MPSSLIVAKFRKKEENTPSITPSVNFTKLFSPMEKLLAHSVCLKICHSISPTIDSQDCRLKFIENLPNLFPVCQICAPFAKHHVCQKKLLILFAQKSLANMLVKLTQRSVNFCQFHQHFTISFAKHFNSKLLIVTCWLN